MINSLSCDYINFMWWYDSRFHWNSSSICWEWSDMLHFAKIIGCFSVASGLTLQSLFMWNDTSILCGTKSRLYLLLFICHFCFCTHICSTESTQLSLFLFCCRASVMFSLWPLVMRQVTGLDTITNSCTAALRDPDRCQSPSHQQ